MRSSICGYKWRFKNTPEITHVCTLKPEHKEDHYCAIWHTNVYGIEYRCPDTRTPIRK